jgi:hypothetical protein
MKLIGSDRGLTQVEVAGRVVERSKDGTFDVSGAEATLLRKSGDFGVAGTNFRHVKQGFICQDCGFNSLYRDHCGRCDGTNLVAE